MATYGRGTMARCGAVLGAALLGLVLLTASGAGAGQRLTFVELFSARGCPLCPPAEAYLGTLAQRDDVLPLAFHVDYWDHLGWVDRFASPAFVRRQQRYSDRLGLPYVYTPQIVVDGARQASGGRPQAVDAAIAAAGEETQDVAIALTRLSATSLRIEIPATARLANGADIVLIGFDTMHRTVIEAGENRGTTLVNYHVVRDVKSIATWHGERFSLTVPLMPDAGVTDFCAVLVQEAGQGRIIGAARIDMRGS